MDSIDLSGLSIADPRPSESEQRDKLNKLAKWRIDPSLIQFPESTSEFEGGHATVLRGLLTPASTTGTDLNGPKNVQGGPSLRDETVKKNVVAVKKLKTENGNSSERVLEEAGLLVGLAHEQIIQLEGFVEDLPKNKIWLIFPWEEHGNLKAFAAAQDWEIPERIWLIGDVASGVEYLHSLSPPIYHGDLKSINVLVNSVCRAVITDLASARRLTKRDVDPQVPRTENKAKPAAEFHATFCATSSTMTFTGNEYTLRWAAPELLMDDNPGLSSDIWALGWVFYEVMTNLIPFENLRKDSVIIKHVIDGKLPCVTDHIRMSLILKLRSLMVKCWSIDPTERPTAEDCRGSLSWMPMVTPILQRGSDQPSSRTRSPELLMKLGDMYKGQNDRANASELYTEALNLFTESSNKKGMASALYGLGQVHWYQCEHPKAATFYSKALEIRTSIGDKREISEALWGLAKVHCDQKEYSKAIRLYSQVIQISIDLDDQEQRAAGLRGLADLHRCQHDYDKAATSYSEAVEIYTKIGSMLGKTTTLAGLADVRRQQSKYSETFALFSESLKISTDIGDKFGRAFALFGLADIHQDQNRPREALNLYKEAAEIYERIGFTRNVNSASINATLVRSEIEANP